jgi:hypothetical protein
VALGERDSPVDDHRAYNRTVRRLAFSFAAMLTAVPASGGAKEGPPSAAPKDVAKSPAPVPADLGFWGILVKTKARWVLEDVMDKDRSPKHKRAAIIVETRDIRTVGTARVGRLRWRWSDKTEYVQAGAVSLDRVAVTPAGLYFIDDDATDEQILQTLKRHPSRSNPPREYSGTKRNGGRYLSVEGDMVCMGDEPLADSGPCDDTCFSVLCIDKDKGVVQLGGTAAPDNGLFAQDGFESPFVPPQ